MKKTYPTGRPNIGKREEQYVLQVLRSGHLSMGPFIEKFEKAFAKRVGARYACAVSSGTAGLHLALLAAGIGKGDEIITSPYSFIASPNSVLYVGAKPVFADIDPTTYNIDPKEIEKKITKKTRAILVVHLFGHPADMGAIIKIAKKHKLLVIEDACESLDATYKGKKAGTFGDAGVFAFYPNKQITTGEGGMIVTNDKGIDQQCRSLRNQGRAQNRQWLDHDQLGYNYRMDEMSAAVGLAQIERIDFLIRKRQELADWYHKELKPFKEVLQIPSSAPGIVHTWFVYVIQINNQAIKRDEVIRDLIKKGVHARPYFPAIHLFEFYRTLGHKQGDYPKSERAGGSTLALPFYVGLTRQDVKSIVQVLGATLKKHARI